MALFTRRPTAPQTHPRGPQRVPNSPMKVHSLTAASKAQTAGAGGAGADSISKHTKGWQQEAWTYYDTVGELRYVCEWLSNALSQCRLVPSEVDQFGDPTGSTDNDTVNRVVADIAGGPAGQADLLGKLATHLTVPGECWLAIIVKEQEDGSLADEWHVLSTSEVTRNRDQVQVTLPDGITYDLDPTTDSVHRIWVPHARVASQSDSVVRASIPTLREMTRLGQYVEATAKSRLVSNGILAVPNEMSVPTYDAPTGQSVDPDAPGLPPGVEATDQDQLPDFGEDLDGLMGYTTQNQSGPEALTDALLETMSTAVQDPSSAAAMVPIVVEAPGEMIAQMQHITLETGFNDTVLKLREAATKRLSLSLNVPAEVLTGLGQSNHWSAWQIEESGIKMHVEPLLLVICDRLTEHVLRPMLAKAGLDPSKYTIWFDTSALTLKPNRSQDAGAAYAAGVIDRDTYREELGFDGAGDYDLNTQEGRQEFAMTMVFKDPALMPALAPWLGVPEPEGGWPTIQRRNTPDPTPQDPTSTPRAEGPPARGE